MQMPLLDDTIIAVSSGWRVAPLGIVRLSGAAAFDLLEQIGVTLPPAGTRPGSGCCDARLTPAGNLDLPATVFWFPGPRSYTGQNVVEIHTVGSLPALRAVSSGLIDRGARRALPGEFTARAFLNGRLHADQVDRVLALINAEDQTAARLAARLGRESYHARLATLNERLTELIARVEAGIDFVEEEDVQFITPAELARSIDLLIDAAAAMGIPDPALDHIGKPHVALTGMPNAGKSTLFNTLLGYERAIVTPVLGTTRDVLSAEIEIDGVVAVLQDCAGLGASADELESAAHLVAERAADQADLVLWVHDCLARWDERETQACRRIPEDRRVLVVSKLDCLANSRAQPPPIAFPATVSVSCRSGLGLKQLRLLICAQLATRRSGQADQLLAKHLAVALTALRRTRDVVSRPHDALALPEIVALELRRAWEALAMLERGPLAEDILQNIYARSCIGK